MKCRVVKWMEMRMYLEGFATLRIGEKGRRGEERRQGAGFVQFGHVQEEIVQVLIARGHRRHQFQIHLEQRLLTLDPADFRTSKLWETHISIIISLDYYRLNQMHWFYAHSTTKDILLVMLILLFWLMKVLLKGTAMLSLLGIRLKVLLTVLILLLWLRKVQVKKLFTITNSTTNTT